MLRSLATLRDFMDTNAKESGIVLRTQELCQAVVEQSDFQSLKAKLDAFMSDELLKFKYQQLNDLGNLLYMKRDNGAEIREEEVVQFETMREELLGNQVVQGFMEAQQQLQQLHQIVGRFLDKTFELGRRPEFEDVHDGSCCGGGCH